jgi:hypothetical protein
MSWFYSPWHANFKTVWHFTFLGQEVANAVPLLSWLDWARRADLEKWFVCLGISFGGIGEVPFVQVPVGALLDLRYFRLTDVSVVTESNDK